MEVDIIKIADKEYMLLDKIESSDTVYCYLENVLDEEDLLIRKKQNDEYIPLTSDKEFEQATTLFAKKHLK